MLLPTVVIEPLKPFLCADALARAQRAADSAYLASLVGGSDDLLAEGTFARLEPMFARYDTDQVMTELLEKAAVAYSDAAVWAAYWVIAGVVIEEARRIC